MLQEAIRQREESSLTNEVEIRSETREWQSSPDFNESDAMTTLREYEKKKKDSMDELEVVVVIMLNVRRGTKKKSA